MDHILGVLVLCHAGIGQRDHVLCHAGMGQREHERRPSERTNATEEQWGRERLGEMTREALCNAAKAAVKKEKNKMNNGEALVRVVGEFFDEFEPQTAEEIDAALVAAGYHPGEVGTRMKAVAEKILATTTTTYWPNWPEHLHRLPDW